MNIRKITRIAFVSVIAVLLVGVSGCDQFLEILSDGEMPQTHGKVPQLEGLSGEILIGVVHPDTGKFASANPPIEYGLRLAIEEINNSQVGEARLKPVIEDGQSTEEGAVDAFKKLINQHKVAAILGPTTSSQAKAVFGFAQEYQVVTISPTAAARGLGKSGGFTFRASLNTEVLITNGVRITHAKLGYQNVAKIYDEGDPFSMDSDAVLDEALAENGVNVLTSQPFRTDDIDFTTDDIDLTAQLTLIKESNPDAVFVSAQILQTPDILIQGRKLGIPGDVPFLITVTLAAEQIEIAGNAAEGAITFTNWEITADTPGNPSFAQNYRTKYDVEPNTFAAQSYAAVYILAEAIANARSADSTAIRDKMANIREFDTVLGKFSFDASGDAIYDPIILIVKNGQFEVFE